MLFYGFKRFIAYIMFDATCIVGSSFFIYPGLDEMSGYAKWALNHMLPAEKKYPKECEEARQDSFKLILKFLDEWGNRSC